MTQPTTNPPASQGAVTHRDHKLQEKLDQANLIIKQITEGHPNAGLVCELRDRAQNAESRYIDSKKFWEDSMRDALRDKDEQIKKLQETINNFEEWKKIIHTNLLYREKQAIELREQLDKCGKYRSDKIKELTIALEISYEVNGELQENLKLSRETSTHYIMAKLEKDKDIQCRALASMEKQANDKDMFSWWQRIIFKWSFRRILPVWIGYKSIYK